jgi:hypothetical protein
MYIINVIYNYIYCIVPKGCDGVENSGVVVDACAVCGGDGSSCAGCDGVSNSGRFHDRCGVCGGDGSSCIGCDGVANSGLEHDECGVCGGEGYSCMFEFLPVRFKYNVIFCASNIPSGDYS